MKTVLTISVLAVIAYVAYLIYTKKVKAEPKPVVSIIEGIPLKEKPITIVSPVIPTTVPVGVPLSTAEIIAQTLAETGTGRIGMFRVERVMKIGRFTLRRPETTYWIEDGKYYRQYYFKSGTYKGIPKTNEYVTMRTTKREYEEMFKKRIII